MSNMQPLKIIHKTAYLGIDASLPSQSQQGKTVLITGGAGGIGFAIARAFAIANASHLILLGRDESRLVQAIQRLKDEVPSFSGRITIQVAELVDPDSLERVWNKVLETASAVDVLILNAAYMGENQEILQPGWRQVWEQYEVNVRGNLTLVDKFVQQPHIEGTGKKVGTGTSYFEIFPLIFSCSLLSMSLRMQSTTTELWKASDHMPLPRQLGLAFCNTLRWKLRYQRSRSLICIQVVFIRRPLPECYQRNVMSGTVVRHFLPIQRGISPLTKLLAQTLFLGTLPYGLQQTRLHSFMEDIAGQDGMWRRWERNWASPS